MKREKIESLFLISDTYGSGPYCRERDVHKLESDFSELERQLNGFKSQYNEDERIINKLRDTIESIKIPDNVFTDLQFIYDHFGELPQVEKFNEEVTEFIESGEDEELVDVWMVATQLIMNSKKLLEIVEFKRERTLERIKSKFYDID